jgi:hypothetical protein
LQPAVAKVSGTSERWIPTKSNYRIIDGLFESPGDDFSRFLEIPGELMNDIRLKTGAPCDLVHHFFRIACSQAERISSLE